MTYQYIAYNPLTRAQLAPPLRMSDVSWSETVQGAGTFTGTLALPRSETARELLRAAIEPDEAAIYVRNTTLATWPWGGVITDQEWNPDRNTLTITAMHWRQWLFDVFLGPKVDLTADNSYNWTQQDQLLMAQQIVGYAVAAGTADGRPPIQIGTETSGKLRDLNIKGLDFKYAGELLDTISNRSGGFEWGVDIIPGTDGLPQLTLGLYYPQRGGVVDGLLINRTPNGGNATLIEPIKRSTATRRTRVWTTGVPETLPFAQDSDPDIAVGFTLLRERVTSYTTVTDRTTLASHARAEREVLNPKVNFLKVRVPEGDPDADSYSYGDRARLIYLDDWYDLDFPAARIVSRTVKPLVGGGGSVELTIDLADTVMPEVDPGGVV